MRTRSLIGKAALLFILALAGCESTRFGAREKGALGGAALGAGLGAIVGNQVGDPGAGIAIGAGFGALSGALIGNEMDNQDAKLNDQQRRLEDQDRQIEENRRLLQELRGHGADVRETDRGVVVNLPDVLFDFNSARLSREAVATIAEIAQVSNSVRHRRISVEGHTDAVGSVQYNRVLSERRARSVADELLAHRVARSRIVTRGLGESEPIASNSSAAGRQRNRRVEVIIEN